MSDEKRKILVASTNPGKIAELKAMLGTDMQWLSLADFGEIPEVIEDGATFAENARKKALGYAGVTNVWTIADDSGLVVDALDGAPGVKSARFSGEAGPALDLNDKKQGQDALATKADSPKDSSRRTLIDHRNTAKVLKLLEGVSKDKRTARFVCRLCLASPEKVLLEAEGTLEGLITDEEIGSEGFGYDPIFFVPHLNKTIAQITREEKNTISHRGNAIRKLKPMLDELITER